MKKFFGILFGAVLTAAVLTGCGDGVDENKPVAQIQAEAAKMDTAAIEKQVASLKKAIEAKAKEADKIKAQLAEIPLTEKLGEKAQQLGKKGGDLATSLNKLQNQLSAYTDALAAKTKK